ncbi:hypothetical protein ACFC8N_46485 [Streptomyces sp. NPDC055966]|uniref:hypothetical protein n=1 Tax=Streptomyces sp. NPDC055966 TaxID=3345669 RepID=UPI0035E19512
MASLTEELRAREAAARRRVEELQAEAVELAIRLDKAREDLSRLEITRETVTQVLADLSAAEAEPHVAPGVVPEASEGSVPHGVGVMMVPPWREGQVVAVLPDVYRDIVEIVADEPGPVQAKQIVPRIGLPTTTGKIEGTRGKLKRLVERGWLDEDAPGQFTLARRGPGRDHLSKGDCRGCAALMTGTGHAKRAGELCEGADRCRGHEEGPQKRLPRKQRRGPGRWPLSQKAMPIFTIEQG